MRRYGVSIPLETVPLSKQLEFFSELEDLGYTDLWATEGNKADGLTPLGMAAARTSTVRLGTAVLPIYTRGPALLAMSAATMAEAAPGRFALGIGTSSNVIVEKWNDIAFDRPYKRARDTLRFLKSALAGQKVTETYETFSIEGFRLGQPPEVAPPIYVAALREAMLRLAGREADGVVLNWLSAEDTRRVTSIVHDAAAGEPRETVCRVLVCPTPDVELARGLARRAIAASQNVPVYAAYQEWLGRGELLAGMWSKWDQGDRAGALEAIPDRVVDDLIVHGHPSSCREQIERYFECGVSTVFLALLPPDDNETEAIRSLALA